MVKIYPTAKIICKEMNIEKANFIGDWVFINVKRLVMGEGSQINAFASVTGGGELIMGRNVVVSYGARLITGTDQPVGRYMSDSAPEEERYVVRGTIFLDDNVFVGANAVICVNRRCPIIAIGRGTVIGAGAYIDRSIPEPNLVVTPMQRLRFRPRRIV